MTPQEAFDIAAKGIQAQGGRSVDEDDVCLYRGPNGCKCAVGHLIPDDLYDPKMEKNPIECLLRRRRIRAHFAGLDACFLSDLQSTHDNYEYRDWPAAMRRLAKRYGLNNEAIR